MERSKVRRGKREEGDELADSKNIQDGRPCNFLKTAVTHRGKRCPRIGKEL